SPDTRHPPSFPTRRSSDLGHGTIVTSLDQPGMLLVEVRPPAGTTGFHGASKSEVGRVLLGAAVAPRQIRPSDRRPLDFDAFWARSEEHTSELQSRENLVCR